ncbi:unnamed protein product [Jaminaea pallidilutea]
MAVEAAWCLCDSSSAPTRFPTLAQSALCLRPSAWITDRASVCLCSLPSHLRLAGDASFLCAPFERVGRKVSFNGWQRNPTQDYMKQPVYSQGKKMTMHH